MTRAVQQRLRKLEAVRRCHGPRVIVSMFPLPDDPAERVSAVDALLTSGEARLRNGVLNHGRPMRPRSGLQNAFPNNSDEWAR